MTRSRRWSPRLAAFAASAAIVLSACAGAQPSTAPSEAAERAGVTGYEATSWQGLVVPAGTPKAVIARLHKEVDAVLRSSEMRERLAAQGSEAVPTTPDAFGKFIAAEIAKWARVAKQAGIKPE